jgi:hypothetical protein
VRDFISVMSRRRIVFIVIAICIALVVIVGGVFIFKMRHFIWLDSNETANEIAVTDQYKAAVNGIFSITLERAFEASSYGGLHGDGTALTIYKFPPSECPALINVLKFKHPEFTWSNSFADSASFLGLKHLIPKELLPVPNSRLLVGRPSPPLNEFYLDESRGILYDVTSRY